MEFSSLILPQNICRTCLVESDANMFTCIQDLVEHDMNKIKLIDILVFLNCLENNDEENWPQGMCSSCVSTALVAYNFKLDCLKANAALTQILSIQTSVNLQPDIDAIDISVVYQDHEYDVPLFSNPALDFEPSVTSNKEVAPLPPVTEITATEQLPRQEGEKKYACGLCSKSFTRIYGLKYHMARHSNVRRHLCPKCGKKFHLSSGLKRHLISHQDVAPFKCGFCNKTYRSRQYLKEHFRLAHSSNSKLFVCVTCGKRFTAKSTLKCHMRSHTGEKKYSCPHCPKAYTRAAYLKIHILTHSGQERPKPFLCDRDGCERRFSTKHSLLVHLAHTHSSERPFKCEACNKGFPTAHGLKVHKETHNSKELCCSICEKKFTNRRVMQKHMKLHDAAADEIVLETDDMILETVVDSVFFD
ncbi:zinc finger protein 26-like [Plodia interpunctella]|uniref:zinc finger protein 26-like n=1 Tax=Plodia interpunctella TaxID=58824 RepID=UPI0023686E63|nr:zinc finger protein 26-like [Plodia interpunctella]